MTQPEIIHLFLCPSHFSLYLCPRNIKSSIRICTNRARQPRWSRYDVEISLISKISLYEQFILQRFRCAFRSQYTPFTCQSFNSQVGKCGFNSVRAAHDQALIDELVRRGIDVSAVFDGTALSFAHHVELDNNRLVIR